MSYQRKVPDHIVRAVMDTFEPDGDGASPTCRVVHPRLEEWAETGSVEVDGTRHDARITWLFDLDGGEVDGARFADLPDSIEYCGEYCPCSEVDRLAEDALNALCLTVQQALGQTDGGWAAQYWAGGAGDAMRRTIAEYVRFELDHLPDSDD